MKDSTDRSTFDDTPLGEIDLIEILSSVYRLFPDFLILNVLSAE